MWNIPNPKTIFWVFWSKYLFFLVESNIHTYVTVYLHNTQKINFCHQLAENLENIFKNKEGQFWLYNAEWNLTSLPITISNQNLISLMFNIETWPHYPWLETIKILITSLLITDNNRNFFSAFVNVKSSPKLSSMSRGSDVVQASLEKYSKI